ncbi:hypothetical protein [Streptomyces adustus]
MRSIRTWWDRAQDRRDGVEVAPSQWAVFDRISDLYEAGEFEEAEAEARALAAAPRVRGGDPWLVPWLAMSSACTAAIAHGQGAQVLPELEAMIAAAAHMDEVRRLAPVGRAGSGAAGLATATALCGLGRRSEAEAAARSALAACEQFLHPVHPRIQDARTLLTRITAEDPDSD